MRDYNENSVAKARPQAPKLSRNGYWSGWQSFPRSEQAGRVLRPDPGLGGPENTNPS